MRWVCRFMTGSKARLDIHYGRVPDAHICTYGGKRCWEYWTLGKRPRDRYTVASWYKDLW